MQNQKVHKENFNYLFKDRGGAFEGNNPETLYFLNTFKTYIENIVSYVRKHYPALPEVYVDFVNNLTLNAGAVYYKGGYYIGLYLGAKIIIGELFNAELSSTNILPEMGNPSLDFGDKKIGLINNGGILSIDLSGLPNQKSNDPLRAFYSDFFSQKTIDFLILHELGHIIRGHCGYKSSLTNNALWVEFNGDSNAFYTPLISQTLEMDADSFAVNHSIILAYHSISEYMSLSDDLKKLYENIETFLENWIFCIYSFFKLSEAASPSLADFENKCHPHPAIRIWLILNNIYAILESRNMPSEQITTLSFKLSKIMEHADFAFSEVTFNKFNYQSMVDVFFQTQIYTNKLTKNWNNVLPLIKSYAIDPSKLPPAV